MTTMNRLKANKSSEAPRAHDGTARFVCISAIGLAICASSPTPALAQASAAARDTRATYNEEKTMTQLQQNTVEAPTRKPAPRTATTDESIRPFRARISDEAVADLRRRIQATRW